MRRALELASIAFEQGEVPIGAVVVHQDQIIGEGFNQTISNLDPSAHAELVAIRQAARSLGNYRLVDCTVYVTIEPCSMCAGLLVHSRISHLIFGALEPKAGAVCSAANINEQSHFNHRFSVEGGILQAEASALMRRFFLERRERKKALKKQSETGQRDIK